MSQGGAAPPRTPEQRAFHQAVHDARMARRKAAKEQYLAKRRERKQRAVKEAAAAELARREEIKAKGTEEEKRLVREAEEFEALQRAQEVHWEATRPRTLAELVASIYDDKP
jgi:hypothetical protein